MNKIILDNDKIKYDLDDKIEYEYIDELINKLKIRILKNTKLEINIKNIEEIKLNIEFEILDNVKLEIMEIKNNIKAKILNKYNLSKNSKLNIIKAYDLININEKNIVNLNDENASCNIILKTVSKNLEKYDFTINHNSKNTTSDIITNGINISGNLNIMVTTFIPSGNKNCVANQQNRIINLTDKECIIKPNLLIEEVDVLASHSALIGSFKDEEIFYLQRLGISYEQATKLLIEGFLKNKITDKIANNFKKYWRWIWIEVIFYY